MAGKFPAGQKIYHVVHVDRLPSIVGDGELWCDSAMLNRQGNVGTVIGMSTIKQRRMLLPVHCHPGDTVGEYVPFYFCPRSIMLYVISRMNHPELAYRGGQGPIVHLEADLAAVLNWAVNNNRRWSFSLSNAGAAYAQFRARRDQFDEIDWTAVAARDFRQAHIKEGKQAELLVKETFPWELIERIGVQSNQIGQQVVQVLPRGGHKPTVQVMPDWYY
jgi:hypothetical protein